MSNTDKIDLRCADLCDLHAVRHQRVIDDLAERWTK